MCSAAEHQSVDSVIDVGPKVAGHMDLKVVEGKWEWASCARVDETLLLEFQTRFPRFVDWVCSFSLPEPTVNRPPEGFARQSLSGATFLWMVDCGLWEFMRMGLAVLL